MLKRWSLDLNLTAGSANLSLRVAVETVIPSAIESRPHSAAFKLRRLLPWLKPPSSPPIPPPKRMRKKKSLFNIGSLRKIPLFRRRNILPATPDPTDDEYELPRMPLFPRSTHSRKATAAVASLWAVVVAWILSERIRRWCCPGGLPGQWSCLSSLLEPLCSRVYYTS